jgi:hypothetical protein
MVRAPVLEAAASFESHERAALAAAISRFDQMSSALDDTRKRATAGVDTRLSEAYASRSAAETALKDAETSAGSSALARALGDNASPTVEQLQVELKAARDRFDAVWSDRELVQAEIGRLSRSVDGARDAVQQAVAAVLAAAPGWAALLAELPAARQRVMRLENLFADLHKLPAVHLPLDWTTPAIRTRPDDYLPDPALATQWREAITALAADATTLLPGDVD